MSAPTVAPCPCCGAYSLAQTDRTSALFAVCDVLCVKALEAVGKRIVRADRTRFRVLGTRPWHVAHTLWRADDATVSKVLSGAWDVVPALLDTHGCCETTPRQVTTMLDSYVHDLVITGTPHTLAELAYRFTNHLGLVPPVTHALQEAP